MNSTSNNHSWHLLNKVLFRFFFVFIILEFPIVFIMVVCSLIGLGMSVDMWVTNVILTPPLLWLNNHIFFFPYNPPPVWAFTATISTVMNITYLCLALIVSMVWSAIDWKCAHYSKLDFWFRNVIRIGLSVVMWRYGIMKIIPVQMVMPDFISLQQPVGDMDPFTVLWTTMGYAVSYEIFTGMGELLGAVLILFRRTRLIGLLILLVILCNIVMLNYAFYLAPLTLTLSFVLLLITVYLLIPYVKNVWLFLFTDQLVNQFSNLPHGYEYRMTTRLKKLTVTSLGVLILGSLYIWGAKETRSVYNKISTIQKSRKYSEVKNFVINNDTLKNLIVGDTIRWRFWREGLSRSGEEVVTLYTMNSDVSKNYSLMRDSLSHTLTLKPTDKKDVQPIVLKYNELDDINWHLTGVIEGKQILVDLKKIDPSTTVPLLKVKPQIFVIDTEE